MTILAAQLGQAETRFLVFMAVIVVAMAGGYTARRAGLLRPEWARWIMSAAIIGADAPVACLAIWHLDMTGGVWRVPVIGLVAIVLVSLAGLALARWRRLGPAETAVFGFQGAMGNVGYTLGGFLCFALWGIQGLAVEQLYCMMWPFFTFLFCFPVARHYGEAAAGARPADRPSTPAYVARMLARSVTDLRSLPLYTAALGLALNLGGAAEPTVDREWHLLDGLMILGMSMQFGSIGLTVQARRLPAFWKPALGSASLKFFLSPLVTAGVALAFGLTGMPLYVCLLLAVMPSALYSVLIANLFGLNKDLANATFILTHAICFAALIPVLAIWYLSG